VLHDQPAHRLGHRVAGQRPDRRPGREPVEHRAGGRRGGQQGAAQPGAVGAERRGLRIEVVGRAAQTGRVRRGDLVDRAGHVQRVLGAVQQEPGPEPVDGGPHVVG
jgi:hypothetical protein